MPKDSKISDFGRKINEKLTGLVPNSLLRTARPITADTRKTAERPGAKIARSEKNTENLERLETTPYKSLLLQAWARLEHGTPLRPFSTGNGIQELFFILQEKNK